MHRLVLMRHGHAAGGVPDHRRPLDAHGREQALSQAGPIARAVGTIDLALVSDATRTLQTLRALRSGGLEVVEVCEEPELYVTDWRGAVDLLRGLDAAVGTALIVGHEPTISTTATMLAGQRALRGSGVGFSTAMAAVGSLDDWASLAPGGMRLEGVLRASV